MNKGEKKKQIFQSMREFEEEFFPKSFEKRMAEKSADTQAQGVSLSKESLEKIRERLAK
ncbi:hypothetical protein ACFLWL_02230 [Chloroflexota bacterium]